MYTINKIASVLNADAKIAAGDYVIEQLLTDSRRLIFPSTTLFFALATARRDAHNFIGEMYERGVRSFVVHPHFDTAAFANANFIFAADTLAALQTLAAYHRKQFHYPVIAITGSNGKTIVKEWLYQLLSPEYNIVRSPRSYNSQLGVALSVWQMNAENNLAIFEAGISMSGEMEKLENIIQPTTGILTNIGSAHHENFVSEAQKTEEKCKLFKHCNTVIANGDNNFIVDAIHQNSKANIITWGDNESNAVQIFSRKKNEENVVIELKYSNTVYQFNIPFADDASVQNVETCIAVLLNLNIPAEIINDRLQALQPVDMRLQLTPAINNCALINDSYSFDTASFAVALDFMQQQNQFTHKTVILSDVPGASKGAYAEIIFVLKARNISSTIVIGEQWKAYFPFLKEAIENVYHYNSTNEFLSQFSTSFFRNQVILLKGARRFGFENIAAMLQQKVHRTVMEISLTAVIHNVNEYRKMLNPGVKIMAMVKASGYGSGSAEIANVLQYHKVDYLAVAYPDEGVELRRANIRLPIMIMNIDEEAFEQVVQYNLEPEIYSVGILKKFDAFLNRQGLQYYPVHIKINTGMHRLGFGEDEIDILIEILKTNNRLVVKSVFSHLVASEDAAEDAYSFLQAEKLEKICSKLQAALNYSFIKHISNSAASIRLPQLQFDMIRLGIGLYGIDNTSNHQLSLQPAVTLKTTVAQLRKVKAGDTVGYNRRGKINVDSIIATLRIGYADGFRRALSNGVGKVFIKGKCAPVVGSVAMDMTMVDVTGINDVEEGDEVEIFGNNISISEVAKSCHTIPYEILTGISSRVKRIYIEE
ncbi:bifunctional UDP-N-acetylmuramoyl-tripeptide:D-alanyl-D-alanine ligase/alanine racemase [Parafilimonas terrae]|uniref:Alanine racemase n=1 Tax=Parafilimonas terrae TaxID=1465490 RepID=A0A1I5UDF0_9BACT|nr:bifunctional UDP-N-acetylmuramoyl-tripeptide:D-alanyl-D-alanine ligase/alanine racemase [Parafilimonas terrae]SFP93047.1 alanine racemase [Parafilimonas terrae]